MLMQAYEMRALIVLLDGVDEAAGLRDEIESFVHKELVPSGNRVLVTSRPAGLDKAGRFAGFRQLTLAPLLLNLPKAGSFLPLPHQPERIQVLQQSSESWDQRVKHRLHRWPKLTKPVLRLRILKLPQCHWRI